MNQQHASEAPLVRLKDTGLALEDRDQDIRDRKVVDRDGKEIGHISSLFIDEDERKVRMLEIRAGGFLGIGDRHFLIPVDAITKVAKAEVHVNETLERIVLSPVYAPALVEGAIPQKHWEPFYGYYGLSPYWGDGYLYPTFPMSTEANLLHEHSHRVTD
jgi:sporulation protein YlmC with PRC-barrel domain